MTLKFPHKFRRELRLAAIQAYPSELYAILLGHRDGDTARVLEVHYPPVRAAGGWVDYRAALADAKHDADAEHLEILGDVHSHPEWIDASPSETDLDGARSLIQGVLGMSKTGGRFKTHLRFWGPIPQVNLLR